MLNGIDSSAEKFLNDLGRLQSRTDQAQRQISSGVRVATPSDDPDKVGNILQARANLDRTLQIRQNLERAKGEVDGGEQALANGLNILDRVLAIATQATSTTQSAETRASLSVETASLLERLVAISGGIFDGRYIFSGDADQTKPYTLDLTQASGVSSYAGTAATRQTEDPSGIRFSISKTAQEIFDNPTSGNVFAAVNGLRIALAANDRAGITTALSAVRDASSHLNQELTFYGTAQDQISAAIELGSSQELRLKTELSNLRDSDLLEATLALNDGRIHQEAALSARARLPRTSLFDFLA
jgi:flagellar hook-associated protein 3 FlgL